MIIEAPADKEALPILEFVRKLAIRKQRFPVFSIGNRQDGEVGKLNRRHSPRRGPCAPSSTGRLCDAGWPDCRGV